MEFFQKGKTVILRSHLNKYLLADDDKEKIRQSRNVTSSRARWTVEFVGGKSNVVRLKSCHGRYLTASDMAFLLGMTGKRVSQSMPSNDWDSSVEWEPQREGFQVKLRSWEGTFLRANGGTPPWRNSITHDQPHTTATQNWILWDVEVVVNPQGGESFADYQSQSSSLSSASDEIVHSEPNSPLSIASGKSLKFSISSLMKAPNYSLPKSSKYLIKASEPSQSGMEFFQSAKAVRLRSSHEKYLIAEEDEESVCQERNGSSRSARWNVEFVQGTNFIRLKSCYGKYLTASNVAFLLGMTGRKVLQTLDSSVEWEPIREGFQVKLKSRKGSFLRANGGLPPWRNSITHDVPHVTATQDWVLWDVDILEINVDDSPPRSSPAVTQQQDYEPTAPTLSKIESSDSFVYSPPKPDGRTIYYDISEENGDVENAIEGPSFIFKGNSVDELTQKLEEETGLQGITVCSRNILNGKLYPLRLHLPPNNSTMHVVVVPASSKAIYAATNYGLQIGNPTSALPVRNGGAAASSSSSVRTTGPRREPRRHWKEEASAPPVEGEVAAELQQQVGGRDLLRSRLQRDLRERERKMGSEESRDQVKDDTGYQAPGSQQPCTNNCGFFGTPATLNLCSKCYKDFCNKEQQTF